MVEVVSQIKTAEEQAEDIKKSARQQARRLRDEAVDAGSKQMESEVQAASADAAQAISDANVRAEAYLDENAKKTSRECGEIAARAQTNMQKTASFIVERIVESL